MRNRVEIKSDAKQLIRVSRVSPLVMSALLVIITFVLERLVFRFLPRNTSKPAWMPW